MVTSGMAIGEACNIKKKDIDTSQERIQIKIRPSYTKGSRRGRNVYVSNETGRELKPILERKKDNDFVFHNSKNHIVAKANEDARFRRLIDSLGIGDKYESGTRTKTFHAFRSYFFTKAMQKHSEAYAHRMLGHKGNLEVYSRWSEKEKLDAYLQVEPELLVFDPKPETEEIKGMKKSFEVLYKESTIQLETLKYINKIMRHVANTGKSPSDDLRDTWTKDSLEKIGFSPKELTEFTRQSMREIPDFSKLL